MMDELTVQLEKEQDKLTALITGRIDSVTSSQLSETLEPALRDAHSVVLDFARVDYITSAGLRVLLRCSKMMDEKGGSFVIINPREDVMNIFRMTHLTDFVSVE